MSLQRLRAVESVKEKSMSKVGVFASALAMVIVCAAGTSFGSVLNDTPAHYPWVKSSGGYIEYDAATGRLDIQSYPELLNLDSSNFVNLPYESENGSLFELHVKIDPVTKTVSLNPDAPAAMYYSSHALYVTGGTDSTIGDIFQSDRPVEFDYNQTNLGQISFRFRQDGDMVAPNDGNIVVHVYAGNFPTDFSDSFSQSVDYSDIFFLPEPATLSLLALGSLVVMRRRRGQ